VGSAKSHSPEQLLASEDASSLLSESRSLFLRQGGITPSSKHEDALTTLFR
ncbi:hypothetical protein AMTR_s00042p00009390, partial [Amborella trichopoda]